MDVKIRKSKYERVMSRLQNRSRTSLTSNSFVTRHDCPSSVRLTARPSVSNVSSSVFSELPIVLNDYVPETSSETRSRKFVKPRKTIPSLDPALSPPRIRKAKIKSGASAGASAPSVLVKSGEKRSFVPSHKCLSARSPSRLKDLKDEIQAFHETNRLMKLRSHVYKSCGIVLDEVGNVAEDKAVQVDALEAEGNGYATAAPLTNGSAGSPLGRTAGSPPVAGAAGAGPSPMAALMNVTDTLPPGSPRSAGGSPPQPPQQRSASRSSQHSPNSSGSNGGRRSSGSRHVSSTTSVSSTEAGEGADATAPTPAPLLKCTLCQERLEDTHFVQCPSQPHHKFCFPCSRDSIKRQQGSEVYCPSGEKCPLANSTVPWAFMQGEIATILGEEFKPKKERET